MNHSLNGGFRNMALFFAARDCVLDTFISSWNFTSETVASLVEENSNEITALAGFTAMSSSWICWSRSCRPSGCGSICCQTDTGELLGYGLFFGATF